MNSGKIRVLIVDDESLARKKIRTFLSELTQIEIGGECRNGLEAVAMIRNGDFDLVFLDIQMPELSGFGVIHEIGVEQMPAIIFITAYDQYAIQAFEAHALDYLLKPFTIRRFQSAVQRAIRLIQHRDANPLRDQIVGLLSDMEWHKKYLERLIVKTTTRILFVKVDEIDWIGAAGNYLEIHVGNETYLIRETMNHLEQKLDPAKFLRIHRSTIVNLDRIKEMQADVNYEYIVILHDGTQLTMSRSKKEKINLLIGDFI